MSRAAERPPGNDIVLASPRGGARASVQFRGIFLGDVAQLEEHLLCKQGVVGSSPIISTTSTNSLLSRAAGGPSLG
jgi:hypothetical protein